MTSKFSCYATCARGVEDLLERELLEQGVSASRKSVGVIYFSADHRQLYAICLWSRVASRVFFELLAAADSLEINSELTLYSQVRELAWELHIDESLTIAVDFSGENRAINNTQYGAMRVKDAVVDRLREATGVRPDVARNDPDIRIQARLHKDKLQIGLDLSGGGLHRRGYRLEQGAAPLRENLAAAILMRSAWGERASAYEALVDPMCGSATFLIEAAMMSAARAPGLFRSDFGFRKWKLYRAEIWQEVLEQARERYEQGKRSMPIFVGADADPRMVKIAQANIQRAELSQFITVIEGDLSAPVQLPQPVAKGLLICNPPYGERMGEIEQLREQYFELARYAKRYFSYWQLAVFTGNRELAQEMRMRPKKVNKLSNGAIACELLQYDVQPESQQRLRSDKQVIDPATLSEGAKMVFNRLNKNKRKLEAWAAQVPTNAYRVYDADLPEYAAAIDLYDNQIHVQEYVAPKSIAKEDASRRFRELLMACSAAFNKPTESLVVKHRKINKGMSQYEKQASDEQSISVFEGKAKFWVNLKDYLDTGLFLDHRILRKMIQEQARGKRFLNLFCYTGSITVAAGLGQAQATVSVDMSKTYLNWAERNLELNHLNKERHTLVQADCFTWLAQCREGFDLIVMDPPSFSNSKRMDRVLDIQKDHVSLIKRCMDLLSADGTLYFSNNLRGFKLNRGDLERFAIEDISAQTIDLDFKRNNKIHRCYCIRHKALQ